MTDAPFSSVFSQPGATPRDTWRVVGSGVHGIPKDADNTRRIVSACEALGIAVQSRSMGSAANCSSYLLHSDFLDGGLRAKTGNYWLEKRGAWVKGPRAVLLLALSLGLRVMPAWRARHGLTGVTLDALLEELESHSRDGMQP